MLVRKTASANRRTQRSGASLEEQIAALFGRNTGTENAELIVRRSLEISAFSVLPRFPR